MLGHESHPTVEARVIPNRLIQNGDGASGTRAESGDHVQERRLSCAVRPKQSGNARIDLEGNIVDGNDVSVPLGNFRDLD